MTINDLIKQCEVRLDYLKTVKISYTQLGDHEMVTKIDLEILEVEQTLNTLKAE